jgi:hypothetical protein
MQRPSRYDENVLDIASGASVRRPNGTDATVSKRNEHDAWSVSARSGLGELYVLVLESAEAVCITIYHKAVTI